MMRVIQHNKFLRDILEDFLREISPFETHGGCFHLTITCSAGNGRSPGRQMRPKVILGDLLWSELCVLIARRIMFG